MHYDFQTVIDRTNTGAIKHDIAPEAVKKAGSIPLTIADMEYKVAPAIQAAVEKAAEHGIYGYTHVDDAYFAAVKLWMEKRFSYSPDRESMFNTAGVVTALGMAVRAFTQVGDGVVIQPPVYPPFRFAVRDNFRTLLENPLLCKNGHYEMDFEGLEKLCKEKSPKLLILCSPHNPVGRVWTAEELTRLGEICLKYGMFVVADEIHADIVHHGGKHTVFATLPKMADNCMVCTAVSKTFNLAGLSCSNIFVADKTHRDTFERVIRRESPNLIPYFARVATIAAYTECDAWLDVLLGNIEENFNQLDSFLQERIPMLKLTVAQGTYLAWVDMRSLGLDDKELEQLMVNKAHLALELGQHFGTGGSGFERINLALPKVALQDALLRLEQAVKGTIR
ncbi:MAG TPA: MalY/PatB family protein [Clostridia bacterium]|nr:MalY/PatB family protein [Clostridia bacterium]